MSHVKYREMYDFYHNYIWEKCSYVKFYQRVLRSHIPPEKAILPQLITRRGKERHPERRFREEYQWKKAILTTYLFRIKNYGLSFEEAIKPDFLPRKKSKKVVSLYKPKNTQEKSQISFIDITLKPEEASIFRRAYSRMLSELESDLEFCEIPSDVPIITAKIKQLKEEIRVFNLYN